ncbi:MAG: helix-turn-helix transcriptional regulator [Gemmatimonadales bacterium]
MPVSSSGTALQCAVGRILRDLRVAKGLSQDAFAELSGVHRTYVGSVERGERNISLSNIVKFSQSLGVHASEVIAAAEHLLHTGELTSGIESGPGQNR